MVKGSTATYKEDAKSTEKRMFVGIFCETEITNKEQENKFVMHKYKKTF